MRRISLCFLVFLMLLPLATAGDVSVSTKRLPPLHIEQAGVYEAIADISAKINVPIGFEGILPKTAPTIAIDFPGGTVADLFDSLVSQLHDYSWRETERGIIHVTQNNAHISLLDVVIAYPGANNKTRQQIWEDLSKRPELSAWLSSTGCSRREYFHGAEFRNHNSPISLPAGSLTLQQLLDDVTIKSGENYWAVLQTAPSTNTCEISIMLWW